MNWQPAAARPVLELRARLRERVRRFFAARGVLEVETPVVVSATGNDPNVPSLPVQPHACEQALFLHTSPEHAMKRLLCAGSGDIYQLAPVFRDGEAGRWHNPEFTIVEWYRTGYSYRQLAGETVELLQELLGAGAGQAVTRLSYREAFEARLGSNPLTADRAELLALCRQHRLLVHGEDAWQRRDLIDLLFGGVVAGELPRGICVVFDYPADQAALARLDPNDPAVAQRFEVFVDGLELANGFQELADAAEQRARFETDRARYTRTGRRVAPLDEHLLAALEAGLPDCAGVAMGFDRVVMLAAGCERIGDVMAFPCDRN